MQALSEYTPMFADVSIDPEELRVLLTEIAPYVVSVRINPAIVNAIIVTKENFRLAVIHSPQSKARRLKS